MLNITGYDGKYQIDKYGNVYADGKIKKQFIGKHGYFVVDLYKKNKRKTLTVHRLVAQHFIDNKFNKPQVNHIDGDKLNNKVENLEWVTAQENIKHLFKVLGHKNNFQTNNPKTSLGKFGSNHPASKPVIANKDGISKTYGSAMDLVRLGFSSSKISECCSGKRKTHKGFTFSYATS